MAVNPFETGPTNSATSRSDTVSNIFKMSTQEAKESILAEASDLGKAATRLNSQLHRARKSRDTRWLRKLEVAAKKLGGMLMKFMKHAIELAAFKLVIEFCALVMTAVFDALVGKGNKPMEISTPGVYFSKPAAQGSGAAGSTYYQNRQSSPFDYRGATNSSPW